MCLFFVNTSVETRALYELRNLHPVIGASKLAPGSQLKPRHSEVVELRLQIQIQRQIHAETDRQRDGRGEEGSMI